MLFGCVSVRNLEFTISKNNKPPIQASPASLIRRCVFESKYGGPCTAHASEPAQLLSSNKPSHFGQFGVKPSKGSRRGGIVPLCCEVAMLSLPCPHLAIACKPPASSAEVAVTAAARHLLAGSDSCRHASPIATNRLCAAPPLAQSHWGY